MKRKASNVSAEFELVYSDVKNWIRSIAIYFAPTWLIILEKISSWEAVIIEDVLKWAILSAWIDIVRRFINSNEWWNTTV